MIKQGFSPALALFALAVLPFVHGSAAAAPSEHLNWGSQINRSECPNGTQIINVTEKILNDNDSGTGGNNWALDDFVRHIKVIQTGPNTFCATASYKGDFTTVAGLSPGVATDPGGTVGAGVVGTFEGGYIAISFTGTLRSTPGANTNGSIGTFDYMCNPVSGVCPGFVDWTTLYFSSTTGFNLDWWGWIYHAGSNGSWVNSSGGNSGDITGN